VGRHWRRQDLVVVAFDRHLDRLREQGEVWTSLISVGPEDAAVDEEQGDPVIESVWATPSGRGRTGAC
jgi:hypothetical protein